MKFALDEKALIKFERRNLEETFMPPFYFKGWRAFPSGRIKRGGQVAHVKRFEPSLVNRRKRTGRYRGGRERKF